MMAMMMMLLEMKEAKKKMEMMDVTRKQSKALRMETRSDKMVSMKSTSKTKMHRRNGKTKWNFSDNAKCNDWVLLLPFPTS